MIVWFLLALVLLSAAANICLWKYGFVQMAEKPKPVMDVPLMDPKEHRAILKRLRRWRDEGKLSREEFEHVSALCASEWNEAS